MGRFWLRRLVHVFKVLRVEVDPALFIEQPVSMLA